VFLRAAPAAGGGSTIEFAGLARTESSETFGAEFADLSTELSAALGAAEGGGAGERGPHGDVPAGKTPSGTSPTAHAGASAAHTPARGAAAADAATDVPSQADERE